MEFKIFNYEFITDNENIKITPVSNLGGVKIIKVSIDFNELITPEPINIRWDSTGNGIYTIWNPCVWHNKVVSPNWSKTKHISSSSISMPIQCYIDSSGYNVVTVVCRDMKTPITIESGIVEETGNVEWKLTLFSQKTGLTEKYDTEIIIDERKVPYEDTISQGRMYLKLEDESDDIIPEEAFLPMYSTWYSYHQNVTENNLLAELEKAAQLGLKTVIIDDGWQTDDNNRGYAYCGEWKTAASKIPDMRDFCNKVHSLGIKVMLWFSVPFVGEYSTVYTRFKEKYLGKRKQWGVLDPRYPEVREYLISCYENAVIDWNLDGLKLDFIDAFRLTEESKECDADMDILSLEEAICTLLHDIYSRLKQIKHDILIEFRQCYVGPVMQQYGNMLRAADCPKDAVTNRIRTIDLRLTTNKAAVHSDMLMWNYNDDAETAAEQIINVMFSVPQISMRIGELPDEHIKMLKFYLSLWQNNRDIIMNGHMKATKPETSYSIVSAEKEGSLVCVSYCDRILSLDMKYDKVVLINGTGTQGLFLESAEHNEEYNYSVYDCIGSLIECGKTKRENNITKFNVPNSGVVILHRNS